MRQTSILALSAAVVSAAALPAQGADYGPPLVIEELPEHVPVEIGSGWYLRGDLTYNVNESVYDDPLGVEFDNQRIGGGVGVGYHFNDLFRADVNLSYISDDSFSYSDGLDELELENRVLAAMLNGYLDLGTVVGLTPYVGAGAGMLYNKHSARLVSPGIDISADDRQYTFAYSLNAGVNYSLTDNLSMDVGYQYLNSPKAEYLDFESGQIEDGLDFHQVRVGLRYDLW
ncbi:outer membrane protein [Chelativorans sp. YIM 93263]|uniref:outer membrane protein n=1 Tax=Chelativorans sp. YIM 93263 TaxID=2906648 RepID=UPI0023780E2C|nr:outer membrane protein [Chelativorans sp. YIM 93263]